MPATCGANPLRCGSRDNDQSFAPRLLQLASRLCLEGERLFNKILVANRGEIALRVMRACREMRIGTVAVYSDADRKALYVRYSDEAYHIGPGPERPLGSLEEARRAASEIGYPVMLKAAAGGGGKGLRLVPSAQELESAWRTARSEAQNAFNDPSVYLERSIERPRHIEIQVLGDRHGTLVYLGERECSLQRRHQKVMEECPSPLADEALRRRMGETAVRIDRKSAA